MSLRFATVIRRSPREPGVIRGTLRLVTVRRLALLIERIDALRGSTSVNGLPPRGSGVMDALRPQTSGVNRGITTVRGPVSIKSGIGYWN